MSTAHARNQASVVILASQQRHAGNNAAARLRLRPPPLFQSQYMPLQLHTVQLTVIRLQPVHSV